MSDIDTKPRTRTATQTKRPRLHKVILLNDDYTPREFVVLVLRAVFRMVYTREVAESKADEATDLGRQEGYPLMFTTEPEE